MKTTKSRLTLLISAGMLTVFTSFCVLASKNQTYSISFGYTNNDTSTYYSGIDPSKSDLLAQLQTLNTKKLQTHITYDNMKSKFCITDPGKSSDEVTGFYSGVSKVYKNNMNREHVWPDSRLAVKGSAHDDPLENDMHMIRPTIINDNSSRGNEFYVEGADGKTQNQGWDPKECADITYRGDAARIIFYCVVADSRLSIVDQVSDYTSKNTMGKLSDLIKWNLNYPVTQREKTRNEQVEKLQGNRNPFIDHPEYVCTIWGNTNSVTKALCAGQPQPEPSPELVLTEKNLHLEVGQTHQLQTTKTIENLIWASTDSKVVSVSSNGLVTAISNGTASINVIKSDGSAMDTCTVTVGKVSSSGCGGNAVTTSLILSSISILGVSILLIRKKIKQ